MAASLGLYAQKPVYGQAVGNKVPLYCGSTGSSSSDSTRLPVLFQARIFGLTPGASYKYFARFISINDTGSSTTTGYGVPIAMTKNGNGPWTTISSPDLSTSGGHDTITLNPGFGEYFGWFGAMYDNDTRFTAGKYVYPMICLQEVGSSSPPIKVYIGDSIQVLKFANNSNSNTGTAIYGNSFVKSKSIVLLYDIPTGTTQRPITITYTESEGTTMSNTSSWYTSKVNNVAGAWGTIIPNNLVNGISRIESRDPGFDTIIFANVEFDATWGNDSTINQKGGNRPIYIKSDIAPLVKPEFEFVTNTTNMNESNTLVKMLVRRKYGNADSSKINAFVAGGTATSGLDYKILTSFPMVFKPYGDLTDTIKVQVMDDSISEPVENVAVRLNNPVNAKIGFQTTHSINITDNDKPIIRFAKKSVTVKENAGILKVKVYINTGATTATSVKVLVKSKTDSTSIPGDFKIGSSTKDTTIQFPGNKVTDSLEFNIAIVNDKLSEDRSDTVVLVLRNPTSPAVPGVDSTLTLIIQDDDAPSIFRLAKSSMTVSEGVGSIKIRINRTLGNISQSDIALSYDSDSKNAQPTSDFTFSPQLITFFSTDPDSFVMTVPIIDDKLSEPREDAVFIIRSLFNAKIAKPDTFRVTIIDNDIPEYPISKVTSTKSPNFTVDSVNVKCAIRGIVYGVNLGPAGTTPGLTFTLRDNTGGIQVFQAAGTKGYTVAEGDSLQVYGKIAQLNGMAQLTSIDTIIKLGSGKTIKAPQVTAVLNESTESALVKYNLVKLVNPSQWPSTAMNANTTVMLKVQTVSDTFNMLIDAETDIDGKSAPSGFFNVAGIGGQNDPTSPYTSGYYLVPRKFSDIQALTVPVFSFTTATSKGKEFWEDSTEGFTLQCANLTGAQQISAVIKGGTAGRNVDYQALSTTRLFILSPGQPSAVIKNRINDDNLSELPETIIWVIRDNSWGTLIGPDSIHTVTLIDDETSGVRDTRLGLNTRLYPNPVQGSRQFNVSAEAVIYSITITDINGKVVKVVDNINDLKAVISTEGFASGLYNISILTEQGRVVKQLSVL